MKVVINDYGIHTWFVVAFEEEFTSNIHNVLYTDAGKINAAMATQWLIDNYSVTDIINVGTAGGNPNKVEKDKIYQIGKVVDRDWKTPSIIYPEIKLETRWMYNKVCYTGDSFVIDWDNDFDLVDMESYAIAKVCTDPENDIPFSCYKYISDTGSDEEWNESLAKCNQAFNEMFKGDMYD